MPIRTTQLSPKPPADPHIAIVVSTYNESITEALLAGATAELERRSPDATLTVLPVPGAWELVTGAATASDTGADAVVCLGCVIKGETEHDRYINAGVSEALASLSAELPIGFGLLTVNSMEQAEARAGGTHGNKGAEAVEAVLHMLGVMRAAEEHAVSQLESQLETEGA